MTYYLNVEAAKWEIYFDTDPPSEVVPGLFIGSLASAVNIPGLNAMGITSIVNLSGRVYALNAQTPSTHVGHSVQQHQPTKMLKIDMDDVAVSIDSVDMYTSKFSVAAAFIKRELSNGHRVLVHCAAGINRSATAIAMYLVSLGYSYDDCINMITLANSRRGVPTLTNDSFRFLIKVASSQGVKTLYNL